MRLIDADEIEWYDHFDSDGNKTKYKVAYSDEMPPTIDAEPVRHGKWENDCTGVLRCSECKEQAPWKYGSDYIDYRWEADYCPNCGCRMDEE